MDWFSGFSDASSLKVGVTNLKQGAAADVRVPFEIPHSPLKNCHHLGGSSSEILGFGIFTFGLLEICV